MQRQWTKLISVKAGQECAKSWTQQRLHDERWIDTMRERDTVGVFRADSSKFTVDLPSKWIRAQVEPAACCWAAHKGMLRKILWSATITGTATTARRRTRADVTNTAEQYCRTSWIIFDNKRQGQKWRQQQQQQAEAATTCPSCLELFAFAGSCTRCDVSRINTYFPRVAHASQLTPCQPVPSHKLLLSCCQYNSLCFLSFDVKLHLENLKLIDMEMPSRRHTHTNTYNAVDIIIYVCVLCVFPINANVYGKCAASCCIHLLVWCPAQLSLAQTQHTQDTTHTHSPLCICIYFGKMLKCMQIK